jgi:FeS assembly SUF system protein
MMDCDTGREMDGRVVQGGDEMPDDVSGQVLDQTPAAPSADGPVIDNEILMEQVLDAIRTVYDPEIPVNIWELGLVYRVDVDSERNVEVDMTLTAPSCPVAGEMPAQVQQVIENLDAVKSCKVELVWEPSWHPGMMSDEARVALDMF